MRIFNQPEECLDFVKIKSRIQHFTAIFVIAFLFNTSIYSQVDPTPAPNAEYATLTVGMASTDAAGDPTVVGRGDFSTECSTMPGFEYEISGDFAPGAASGATGDTNVPGVGNQVIDNDGGGPGQLAIEPIYGVADNAQNIEVEVAGFFGAAGAPISMTVTTTIDFDFATTPGEFAFIIADVEQDQVQVCALDANGVAVPTATIATWFVSAFDADTSDGVGGIDPTAAPTWDTATATLVGQEGGGVRQTVYQPDLPDNEAGAAWFEVNIPITQLSFKSQALGVAPDDPSQHFIFASRCTLYDQAITKVVASPPPYTPGSTVTYDVTVCNQGNVDSGVLEVTDVIPAGMTLSTSDANGWAGPLGGPVTNMTPNIVPDACEVLQIDLTIDPDFMGTTLTNNVEISSDNGNDIDSDPDVFEVLDDFADDNDLTETDGGDDEDPELIMVDQTYDLALIKETTAMGPFAPGQDVPFTITVCNQGTIDAANVQVMDMIPVGMTLSGADMNGWAGPAAGPVTNTIPSVTAGTCSTVDIILTIDPTFMGTSLINNAQISVDDGDDVDSTPGDNSQPNDLPDDNDLTETDGGDDEDPEEILIGQVFDLALIKTVSASTPGPYSPGDAVTFDIEVINQGTLDAFAVSVIDYIPAGLILNDAAWTSAGADATQMVGNIAAGATANTTITFMIDPTFTGTSIINDSEIFSADDDTNVGNTPPIDIDSAPGNNATPDDIAGNDDTADIAGGDDQDPEEIMLVQIYDLALIKEEASAGPYSPGDDVTYTITVENQGTLDAGAITITDFIPAGMTLSGANMNAWAGTLTGPVALSTTGPVAGGTASFDIILTIDPTFTGSSIVNFAEISSDSGLDVDSTPDPINGNDAGGLEESASDDVLTGDGTGAPGDANPVTDEDDHDPELVMINQVFDLALIKEEATAGPYAPGDNVTFAITVFNQGTLDAFNVSIVDDVPAGLILNDANWTVSGSDAMLNTAIPFIASGGSVVQNITFTIDPTFMGSQIINDAEIAAADDDTNAGNTPPTDVDSTPNNDATPDDLANNDDTADTAGGDDQDPEMILIGQVYDLALMKEESSAGPYAPGDDVTYTITVCNQGTLDASNVGVVDFIPADMDLSAADANGWTGAAPTVTNTIASIPAGMCTTLDIVLTIDPNFGGGTIVNFAEISADDGDDIDSAPDAVNGNDAGGAPDTASDDVLTGDGSGTPGDTNPATDEDDHDPEQIEVVIFDLALTKTLNAATPGPFTPGSLVTFDLNITNQGTADAFNVSLVDQIPAGLTLADSDWTNAGGVATIDSPITFIAAGATVTEMITFIIDAGFTGTIVNDSEIASADNDTNPGNTPPTDVDSTPNDDGTPDDLANNDDTADTAGGDDQDPEEIMVVDLSVFDLALTKTLNAATPGPFAPGDVVTFDINIINQGNVDAFNVGIIDDIPTGLTLADGNWTGSGSSATPNSLIPFIPSGATVTEMITFVIDAGFTGTIVNDAEINEADDDTNPNNDAPVDVDSTPGDDATPDDLANNDDVMDAAGGDDQDPEMITVAIGPIFDLALTKTLNAATPGPFMPGDIVTFDLNVTNQGNIDAFNVGLVDAIPAGLTLADSDWTAAGAAATLNSPIPFVGVGATITETINFVIDAGFSGTIINDAEISEADDDTNPANGGGMDVDSTPGDDATPLDTANNDDTADTTGGDDQDPEEIVVMINQVFDLALTKTLNAATSAPFEPGDIVTFDLTVINQGTANAFNIGLVDDVPTGLILADGNWTLAGTTATLNAPIPFLAVGANTVIPITFQIDPTFTGTSITNDAEISEADDDTNPGNMPPVDADSTPGDDATPDDLANDNDCLS